MPDPDAACMHIIDEVYDAKPYPGGFATIFYRNLNEAQGRNGSERIRTCLRNEEEVLR